MKFPYGHTYINHTHLHQSVDWHVPLEDMPPEERRRAEHQLMHEKYEGGYQLELMLVLAITLAVAQIVLMQWKRSHYRSYMMTTFVIMWILPAIISCYYQWLRFIIVWTSISLGTIWILDRASTHPIATTTPRLVYKWFYFIYLFSYGLGIVGYLILMLTFFGINNILRFERDAWMPTGLLFVFYGLYIGVLGRDMSEICSEKMAAHIGYYTPDGLPRRRLEQNICAICGNQLQIGIERNFKLSCGHVFHEFCLRGWCIVGKKQTCPYCNEKVNVKKIFSHPWERPHLLYGLLLDWIRWLVAWQPMIIFLVQGIRWLFGTTTKTTATAT